MGILTYFEEKLENFMVQDFFVSMDFWADDLIAEVCRQAERQKYFRSRRIWIPNRYEVELTTREYRRLESARMDVEKRIVASLTDLADTQNYAYTTPFKIIFTHRPM